MSAYKNSSTFNPDDIAQSFLRDKMSKHKSSDDYTTEGFNMDTYTPDQLQSLDDAGGPKQFGTEYQDVVTNQDDIDKFNDNKLDKTRGFDADSDSGRNYSSGAWGSGNLDAAGLAEKYNLDTSQQGRGDGHIWGRNADGSEVYIGKSSMDLASNQELIKNHSKQAGDEVDHSGVPESLSSSGDIKGAILTEWNGGAPAQKEPEAITKKEKVEYSPEIQQAKERVGKYENDVMSGKTSQDIFTKADYSTSDYKLNLAGSSPSPDYKLNFQDVPSGLSNNNYQMTSPETEFSGSNISAQSKPPASQQAAFSFLENQKKKTMKQMFA